MIRRWLWEMAGRLRGRCVTAGVAVCLLAAPALALPIHPYQRQPVSRVIDPLMRQILTEMDLSLRNYSPIITIVTGGGGTASFDLSDAAFILHDDLDANKRLQWQLSGITTLTTRTLTAPDASGILPLPNLPQTWTRTQTFKPSVDERAILIDGFGSGVASSSLFTIGDISGNTVVDVSAGGAFRLNSLLLYNGDIGSAFAGTINPANLSADRDISLPDASGILNIRTGSVAVGRIPFYDAATAAARLAVDVDLSFAADSIVVTKARIPTSIRVGAGAGISVLNHGTWTPTRSAEANLDANVTTFEGQFLQVGNTVTCSGRFTVDATAPGAASFELSLPVTSNIGAVEDLAGVAFSAGATGEGVQISGNVANNTAVFAWTAVTITALTYSFTLVYQVI